METIKTADAATDTTTDAVETVSDDAAEKNARIENSTSTESTKATGNAAPVEDAEDAEDAADADDEDTDEDDGLAADEGNGDAPAARSSAVLPGAAAVVGAALGLVSLTGTWMGTVLSARRELVGQIGASSASPAEQINQIYAAPWHTVAAVNGGFALVALIVAGVVLLAVRDSAPWTRALAWGGLVLGVLGLLIAVGMYFDLFASLPTVPAATAPAGSGG
ncbi:hypothetical protein ACIP98_29820 [Streptomyces sp. NPDC088354]|uniref:hypothetical protein n=1 Tax=unclassified Streptomyces TaxID=2593676 RepID=UPI0029B90ABF|nr:hypothetical protein [Streptomyces sp. MI02-7b]MDX3073094.1 hypothetical protein [Streptomyces sp. MI02-7b]